MSDDGEHEFYKGYVYCEYPAWRYHADGIRKRIVNDAFEDESLGTWWFPTPTEADHAVAVTLQEVALSIATDPDDASDIVSTMKETKRRARKG